MVLDDDTHLLLLRTAEGLSLRRGGPLRGFRHTFGHAVPGGTWHDLPAVEATFLTPLFTSVQLGLYATSNGRPSTSHAHFPWFDVTYPSREQSPGHRGV